MNDRMSGVGGDGRRPGVALSTRMGTRPAAFAEAQGQEPGAADGPVVGSATSMPPYASWYQAARLSEGTSGGGAFPVPAAHGQLTVVGMASENAFVELVVSSFKSFRDVGGFQRALASLPEAGSIRVRQLHQGTLQVSVQCGSAGSLLRSLAAVYERAFTVLAREPHRIELSLVDVESRAASLA